MHKKIIIVGGAQGVGRSVALQLLAAGIDQVVVVDRSESALKDLVELCDRQRLRRPEVVSVDIRDRAAVERFVDNLKSQNGVIEALVITAGIHSTYPVEFISDEQIAGVLDVNLVAPIILIQKFLPIIKKEGKIILISSIAASIGVPMSSVYSASKAGIERVFESLSTEIKYQGIYPIIIQPGNVNTGFNETGNTFQLIGNRLVDRPYMRVLEKIDSKSGISPDVVAKKVTKILFTAKPKMHYLIGLNAKKANWAIRLFGRNIAVRLMARYFGF